MGARPISRQPAARPRAARRYASASDPRVLVGLGDDGGAVSVEVRWPDGTVEQFSGVEAGRYTTLRQGEGL